jgi:hypothetical protein
MSETNGHFQAFVRLRSHTTGDWIAPKELRPLIVKDADGGNLTEVVVKILADVFKIPFEPNGRKTAPSKNAEELNLRLPWDLKTAIGARANENGRSLQREIIAVLCDHYGLALPEPPRRPRKRRRPRTPA